MYDTCNIINLLSLSCYTLAFQLRKDFYRVTHLFYFGYKQTTYFMAVSGNLMEKLLKLYSKDRSCKFTLIF